MVESDALGSTHSGRGNWNRSVAVWVICLLATVPLLLAVCLVALESRHEQAVRPSPKAIEGREPVDVAAAANLAYVKRADVARQRAFQDGWITYDEVLDSVYGEGVITPELLAAKMEYRKRMAGSCIFFADYKTLEKRTPLQRMERIPNDNPKRVLIGLYDSRRDEIDLATAAGGAALFHEAGHALQREALQHYHQLTGPSSAASLRESPLLDRAVDKGQLDHETARRFRYLSSQDEFEVRLQDLNRFFYTMVSGQPIMRPEDSVRALAALGMPLEFEETREIFHTAGRKLDRQTFDALVDVPEAPAEVVTHVFDDAADLLRLRKLALRAGRELWQEALRKIILEAPGHL